MKRVLLTGSNGLLRPKITANILATKRADLIATSKGANRFPANEGFLYEELDISDAEKVKEIIERFQPNVIINTAAVTNVDIAEKDKEQCRRINIDAVGQLTKICAEKDIHFIHLSTDFVFDGAAGPYREDDTPNPLSYYGESKVHAEEIIKASNCKWTIVRTILVYGIVSDLSRSNIVLWAKSALEKGSPINVVHDQWRMPTLAEDLAEACLSAAEKEACGIYHVSGKDMMSIIDLVQRVAEFWNLDRSLIRPISSDDLKQDARRPKKTGFVLDKANKELDYRPHSFAEGLSLLNLQLQARD